MVSFLKWEWKKDKCKENGKKDNDSNEFWIWKIDVEKEFSERRGIWKEKEGFTKETVRVFWTFNGHCFFSEQKRTFYVNGGGREESLNKVKWKKGNMERERKEELKKQRKICGY